MSMQCFGLGVLLSTIVGSVDGADSETSDGVLEEVIVTATKRESSLQDTALSVGVLTGTQLAESGALNVEDYWRSIPSLTVTDSGFGGTAITIRGLGEEPIGINESMTAVYFDETPLLQADGLFTAHPDFNLVDINRIEVLRGPQGTLFGASAMGGAIRIISNSPDPERQSQSFEGLFSGTAHGGENYAFNAIINQPMGSDSAARLVAYYRDRDGWIDDIGQQQKDVNTDQTAGLRLAVSTEVGDRLSLTGKIQYQDLDGDSYNFVDPKGKPEIDLATNGNYQVALLSDEFRDEQTTLYSLNLDYSGRWGDWTSITSYLEYDVDLAIDLSEEANAFILGFYFPLVSQSSYQQQTVTQEIRVVSKPESRFDWLAGVFFLDQDAPREDLFIAPGFLRDIDVLATTSLTSSRRDYGVFGELSWQFRERWTASLGVRWFDLSKKSREILNDLDSGFMDQLTELSYDETGATPKASLAWAISDEAMLYVLASDGFRPGGGNTVFAIQECGAPVSFDSDQLRNFEIASKNSWRDKRVTFNASIYHIDWSDAQISLNLEGCNNEFVDNVGEVVSDGLELELKALLSDSWELQAAAGFNDSRLAADLPGIAPAGTAVPLVPEVTASIASTYRFALFERLDGFLRADLQYTGSSYSSISPDQRVRQSSYNLFNLRLGLETRKWQTVLFADNLFDEQATLLCCRIDGGFTTNRPRTVGVRASFHF